MITAQVEDMTPEAIEELQDLLAVHYEELALDKDKVPLDPQYELYLKKQAEGTILYVTLRERGNLLGYFIGSVAPGAHYKTCLTLIMDIFYVSPTHRGRRGGVILMNAVEKEAKRRGVQRWFMGHKTHMPDAGRLFKLFGLREVETYYSKWIGD